MSRFRNLQDRVIIVTGSSRGIGREIARLLLKQGCSVVINGRNAEQLERTGRELTSGLPDTDRSHIAVIPSDVSTEAGARVLIQGALDAFGRIDGLINNAGVSMRGSIMELREATVDHLYRGNILASVLPTVTALPHLRDNGGSVVFVSTVSALWGFPGVSIYSATKCAVESFARALDAEFRSVGLRTSIVFLGFVENDPDKETFAADGSRIKYKRKAHLTQEQAAAAIVGAFWSGKQRVITIRSGKALDLLARFLPRVVSYVLSRTGGHFHKVEER